METGHIVEWGEWDALFSLRPDTFCFTGGGVGVWLGLLLSARITGCRPAGKARRFSRPQKTPAHPARIRRK